MWAMGMWPASKRDFSSTHRLVMVTRTHNSCTQSMFSSQILDGRRSLDRLRETGAIDRHRRRISFKYILLTHEPPAAVIVSQTIGA
jgi:hypothetical protein